MTESDDYKRGFYDGFKAARTENHYERKVFPTQPLPPRTEDIMWPDRLPTTSPFPSTMTTNRCNTCGIEMKGAWGYVCHHPKCPTRVTCSVDVNSFADNNMSMLKPDLITTLKTTGEIK